jgi:hypothetical protein
VEYQHSPAIAGRIAFSLPAGEYQVTTRFTQNTPARLAGNTISLITILTFAGWISYNLLRQIKQKTH